MRYGLSLALAFVAAWPVMLAPVLASGISEGTENGAQPVIAGWVEDGWIGTPPLKVKVKLDTGAKTSSIHAAEFREYLRDGKPHVSFTLVNNEGQQLRIDQPVVRTASIRRAGVELSARPVIRLDVCVAGVASEVEFSMADRSELRYPVLIGRTFLAGRILVDSARTFRASGRCKPR